MSEVALSEEAEALILSVIRQESDYYEDIWGQVDLEMKQAMLELGKELDLGFVRRKFLSAYWWYVSRKMTEAAASGMDINQVEKVVGEITSKVSNDTVKLPFLRNRAKRSLDRIEKWISGSVLDLGCGDGMLATAIRDRTGSPVLAADVLDYRAEENKSLPFLHIRPDARLDLDDNQMETTVLWTVLHHSNDPEFLLREAIRVTSRRVIIVEGYVDNPRTKIINCFYDWYFNRPGKGEDINVPFNYRTTQQWRQQFKDLSWQVLHDEYLGVDETVAPERHMLYVIEPKNR